MKGKTVLIGVGTPLVSLERLDKDPMTLIENIIEDANKRALIELHSGQPNIEYQFADLTVRKRTTKRQNQRNKSKKKKYGW